MDNGSGWRKGVFHNLCNSVGAYQVLPNVREYQLVNILIKLKETKQEFFVLGEISLVRKNTRIWDHSFDPVTHNLTNS